MRDLRLDFLRGIAVCMIFVDHVPGNPLRHFTFHKIGYSDAAELFVFVSGLACGIAYSRVLAREGLRGLLASATRRVGRIYLFYALVSLAIALLIIAAKSLAVDERHVDIDNPIRALVSALLLLAPMDFTRILVLYMILTLLTVPTLVVAKEGNPALVLVGSGLVWVACQLVPGLSTDLTHWLYFNPLAWQFLFVTGVTITATLERDSLALQRTFQRRWLALLAWTVVIGVFLIKLLASPYFLDIDDLQLNLDALKDNLSPLRLVHFFSATYLVAYYVQGNAAFLKWAISRPFIAMGKNSLEVFSVSLVLTYAVTIFESTHVASVAEWLAVDGLTFLLLALTAVLVARRKERARLVTR